MIRDYVSIARPSHWLKNVFMLPGVLLAWLACPEEFSLGFVLLGVFATCLICSSNYTVNEVLDAKEDRHHPEKRDRPAASGRIRPVLGYLQWIVLILVGLYLSWLVSVPFLIVQCVLVGMGILYNVRPIRTKDWPYLDVLSESVNNPIRLLLGWYAARCPAVPPASLLLSYWMLGAYFMAVKRFAEMRHIGDADVAAAYRKSFAHYTPERLLVSILFYVTAAAFFGGVFLIRYRVEMILAVPVLAGFVAYYLWIGHLPNSPAQHPELLCKRKGFLAYALVTAGVLLVTLWIRLPWLSRLFESSLPGGLR